MADAPHFRAQARRVTYYVDRILKGIAGLPLILGR
jgi:hypothetical protein